MKSPNRAVLLACLALSACGSAAGGSTLEWAWQYSGTGAAGAPLSASGMLYTNRDPDGDGWYQIERITGERDGVSITALYPAGQGIPGNVDPATGVPFVGNNLIRRSGSDGEPQLDKNGLQFSLADGSYSNVFYASFLSPPTYLDFHSVPPFPAGAVPPNSEPPVSFSAEPSDSAMDLSVPIRTGGDLRGRRWLGLSASFGARR